MLGARVLTNTKVNSLTSQSAYCKWVKSKIGSCVLSLPANNDINFSIYSFYLLCVRSNTLVKRRKRFAQQQSKSTIQKPFQPVKPADVIHNSEIKGESDNSKNCYAEYNVN